MEISLLQLVMAILMMASGFDNADQDFANYLGLYQGEGWHDPYAPQNFTCNITGPETDINVSLNSTLDNQTISNETLTNSTDVNVTVINETDATNTTSPENPEELEINHTFIVEDGSVIIYTDVQIYSPDTKDKFNRFVDWSNPNDFIYGFGLGDQIDDPNKLWQLDDFYEIDAHITYPHEYVKGNHEGRVIDWDHNDKRLIQIGNTCFALMDSYNGETHGAWRLDQVEWLDLSMSTNAGSCDHYIVLSHHAIYDPTFDSRPLADDMKAVLESHQSAYTTVRHYRGHNEWYTVDTDAGIDYVTVPAVRQLTDRDNAAGIVFDTATAESQLCWTGKPCQTIFR